MPDDPTESQAEQDAIASQIGELVDALVHPHASRDPVGEGTPPRCDCPALPVPHVHLQGGPAALEADA